MSRMLAERFRVNPTVSFSRTYLSGFRGKPKLRNMADTATKKLTVIAARPQSRKMLAAYSNFALRSRIPRTVQTTDKHLDSTKSSMQYACSKQRCDTTGSMLPNLIKSQAINAALPRLFAELFRSVCQNHTSVWSGPTDTRSSAMLLAYVPSRVDVSERRALWLWVSGSNLSRSTLWRLSRLNLV